MGQHPASLIAENPHTWANACAEASALVSSADVMGDAMAVCAATCGHLTIIGASCAWRAGVGDRSMEQLLAANAEAQAMIGDAVVNQRRISVDVQLEGHPRNLIPLELVPITKQLFAVRLSLGGVYQDRLGRLTASFDTAVAIASEAPIGIGYCAQGLRMQWVNSRAGALVDCEEADMLALGWLERLEHKDVIIAACAEILRGEKLEVGVDTTVAGADRHLHVRLAGLDVTKGGGFVITFEDVTASVEKAAALETELLTDPLTGLGNRTAMNQRLNAMISSCPEHHRVAVMFLDLDNFKKVNDTLGHDAGDELLRLIATRLGSVVREKDFAVRLAGDEFVVGLAGVSGVDEVRAVADRIVETLAAGIDFLEGIVTVTPSVGIAFADANTNVADVISQADSAMYAAKHAGKGCWRMAGV